MQTKLCLIKIDSTDNWNENYLDGMGISKVEDICLVDKSRIVHLCELVPSYRIIPLYSNLDTELPENQFVDFEYHNKLKEYDRHCSSIDRLEFISCKDLDFDNDKDYDNELGEIKDVLISNRRL